MATKMARKANVVVSERRLRIPWMSFVRLKKRPPKTNERAEPKRDGSGYLEQGRDRSGFSVKSDTRTDEHESTAHEVEGFLQ